MTPTKKGKSSIVKESYYNAIKENEVTNWIKKNNKTHLKEWDNNNMDSQTLNETEKIFSFKCNIKGDWQSYENEFCFDELPEGVVVSKRHVQTPYHQILVDELFKRSQDFIIPKATNHKGDMSIQICCYGWFWNYRSCKYTKRFNGEKIPKIPKSFLNIVDKCIRDAMEMDSSIPFIDPDICIVNFYNNKYAKIGMHQDKDEDPESLKQGIPVLTISIGANMIFSIKMTNGNIL